MLKRHFKRQGCGLVLAVMSLLLAACATPTRLLSSWTAPDATQTSLSKIAVFVISPNKERAQLAESIIAGKLGSRARPGHQLLQAGDEGSKEKVEARLRQLDYDAAITVRLLSVEDKETYVPPMLVQQPTPVMPGYLPGYGFYSYYGMGYQQTYVLPGHIDKHKSVVVETVAHSLKRNDAVWIGVTETRDPDSVADAADEIGTTLAQALEKAGLIAR